MDLLVHILKNISESHEFKIKLQEKYSDFKKVKNICILFCNKSAASRRKMEH